MMRPPVSPYQQQQIVPQVIENKSIVLFLFNFFFCRDNLCNRKRAVKLL
jgi:hypothetical protein